MKAILLVSLALVSQACLAAPAAGSDPACRVGAPVDESGYVTIGGIRQWVAIKGVDCANPVVLLVHGGPGNPSTPFADAIYGGWQHEFTLVQWDQRGSGKTHGANPGTRDAPLSIEQMTADGIDVARYASRRLGKRRVILTGGSWGSALAVHMAQAEPDLFHAYVGTSQLVSYADSVAASYVRVLGLARAAGDTEIAGSLEALGAPPWNNPRAFGSLRRAARKYETQAVDPAPAEWWRPAPGYDTPEYEAEYEAGEDFSFVQFVGLEGDGMGPGLDIRKLGSRFEMPVYLIQGREDLLTTPEISHAYFAGLAAPDKQFILVQRTGHDPNRAMIAAQLGVLRQVRAAMLPSDKP